MAGTVSLMDMLKVPLATALFIGSVYLLTNKDLLNADSTFGVAAAVVCIGCLVYSFMLYSNLSFVK